MDKVLKQRLVGASILIALAVIFLPMLFSGGGDRGDEQRQLVVDVPPRDAGERRVRRLALDPDAARQPPADARAEPRPSRPEPGDAPDEPRPVESEPRDLDLTRAGSSSPGASAESPDETRSAAADEPETASQDEPAEVAAADEPAADSGLPDSEPGAGESATDEPAPAETSTAGSWVVQVAVFSSRETAGSIRQRLIELGHRVSMDVLIRDQAELFRLRTGPYAGESAAEQARGQIAATVAGVQPVARQLSGDGAAEDRQGLVVQVGSFASNNNAERLVGQLTAAGYDAFMYGEESGGRTIWRVRVGAFDERAGAESLLETLRQEQGLEGIVVSHP